MYRHGSDETPLVTGRALTGSGSASKALRWMLDADLVGRLFAWFRPVADRHRTTRSHHRTRSRRTTRSPAAACMRSAPQVPAICTPATPCHAPHGTLGRTTHRFPTSTRRPLRLESAAPTTTDPLPIRCRLPILDPPPGSETRFCPLRRFCVRRVAPDPKTALNLFHFKNLRESAICAFPGCVSEERNT